MMLFKIKKLTYKVVRKRQVKTKALVFQIFGVGRY
jgi:hypothetical protein